MSGEPPGGGGRGPLDFEPDDSGDRTPETPEEQAARWARRRDPDLEPSPAMRRGEPVPVPRAPGASRYGWFLGVVAVLLIAVVTINAISTGGGGSQGVAPGARMPPFAMPLVTSPMAGRADANVATAKDQGDLGRRPACTVRGRQILNVCQLWEQGPVVLAFFATRGRECVRQLDTLERLRARFPRLRFAAVAIRGELATLRRLARTRGYGFPIGYDRDGAVANLYGVAVCPHVTFARRGGRVVDTTFGEADAAELAAQLRRLDRLSR